MNNAEFKLFLKSINEARAIKSGKLKASRKIDVKPPQIKAIRIKLHVSQSEFAHILGISAGTLRNWEQGRTYPEGAARVLLKVAQVRPDAIQEALQA